MTEHYTMQEAVEVAREIGFDIGSGITERVHVCTTGKVHDLINTAVARKLAEAEERDASQVLAISRLEDVIGERDEVIDTLRAQLAAAEKRVAHNFKRLVEIDTLRAQLAAAEKRAAHNFKRLVEIDTLRAQLAAAEKRAAHNFKRLVETETLLFAAEDRVKELEKDAKRYEWLVENATIMTSQWTHDSLDPCSTKQPLDNCIDAAIERSE